MASRLGQSARIGLLFLFIILAWAFVPKAGYSAPFAAMVMDARTGEIIHSQNADTRLHPASLTKMMTLYVAFQAIQRGEISLDTEVTITAEAANEPPSKLGLRAGQRIRLRYLLRAAAVKSANDAATAIGIAISGSQPAFAARMNATAQAMGLRDTHFVNMHGLTVQGHYSSARDMTILGRHMIYDYPQYYNLFSRRTADAGIAEVANTNRRFLDSYPGADGIKTGFTNAAGYNIVASAERGQVRIIATVFGGTSTANRNARVSELLDMGFARAPARANVREPAVPSVTVPRNDAPPPPAPAEVLVSSNAAPDQPGHAGRTIRVSGAMAQAMRPPSRPGPLDEPAIAGVGADAIELALAEAMGLSVAAAPAAATEPAIEVAAVAAVEAAVEAPVEAPVEAAPIPFAEVPFEETPFATEEIALAEMAEPEPEAIAPASRPIAMVMAVSAEIDAPVVAEADLEPEVITRISTSGGRHWGINVGRYRSHSEAERILIQVALGEMDTLEGGLRRVVQRSGGFDANIMGLTRDSADLACRRLQARGTTCFMIGTDG